MAGTMSGIYVGVSGLQTSQNALNTTAHNLSNIDTTGYSRQQILQTDISYNRLGWTAVGVKQSGLGTTIASTRQVRDKYLDQEYRLELGRQKYYEAQYNAVEEVENCFGEMEGSTFQSNMEKLWTSFQELQKQPNNTTARDTVVSTSVTFIERANQIYSQLVSYQKNLNSEITKQVDKVNSLANQIYDYTNSIVKYEASGSETASDLRDLRNQKLDELSKIINIEVVEQSDGYIDVYAEDHLLITMDRTFEMGTKPVEDGSDLLKAYWKFGGEDTFQLNRTISSNDNSDIGSLKGFLMSRGEYTPNYTDIPVQPYDNKPVASQFGTTAEYDAAIAKWNEYEDNLSDYNKTLNSRSVANLIAQFDQLIHGMVTKINDVLAPNTTITDTSGKTYTILDEDKAGVGFGVGNDIQGTELFSRRGVDRYTKTTIQVEDAEGNAVDKTVYVYNEEDPTDYYSLYTLGQLQVNPAVVKNSSLLPINAAQNEESQEVAQQLLDIWNENFATLDPNTLVNHNFSDYYASMIEDFSNRGYTANSIATSQSGMVNEINGKRQEVVGVSSDEELSNLIRFQHAYNASSRYISTVSDMISHIIEKLG